VTKPTKRRAATTRKRKPAAKAKPKAKAARPKAARPTPKDEAAYVETVIATGEAARLDENGKLPAGATHKIVEDEAGNVKVVRRRFSMT
jgi:hypothetical protein